MFLKKMWLTMLCVVTSVLLLAGCGSNDASGEIGPQNGPQDGSPGDIMPISEGLDKYPVWFESNDNPTRGSSIRNLFVFENGNVTRYSNFSGEGELTIEKIKDMSDDEIIQYVKEKAEIKTEGKYTLNINLDDLGQSSEMEEILLTGGTEIHSTDLEATASEKYSSSAWVELNDKYPNFDSYLSAIKKGETKLSTEPETTVEINGDKAIYTTTLEEGSSMENIESIIVQQTIFDTTFSGLKIGKNASLLTRVDESFAGFSLDTPDADKKNVTIEGK